MISFNRNIETQALVNKDADSLAAYKTARDRQKKIERLDADINNVRQELDVIKNLLQDIIKRGNYGVNHVTIIK